MKKLKKLLCAALALAALSMVLIFPASAGGDDPGETEGLLLYVDEKINVPGFDVLIRGRIVKGSVRTGDTVELRVWNDATGSPLVETATVEAIEKAGSNVQDASQGSYVGIVLNSADGGMNVDAIHAGDALVSFCSPLLTLDYAVEGTLAIEDVDNPYYYASESGKANFYWGSDVNAEFLSIPDSEVGHGETAEGVIIRTDHPVTWYVGQTVSVRKTGLTVGTFTVSAIGQPIFDAAVNGIGFPAAGRTPSEVASPEVEKGLYTEEFSVGVGWFNVSKALYLNQEDEFIAGDVYVCKLDYRAYEGYFFSLECDYGINGSYSRVDWTDRIAPDHHEGQLYPVTASADPDTVASLGDPVFSLGFDSEAQLFDWWNEDRDGDGHKWHYWSDDPFASHISEPFGSDGAIMSSSWDTGTGEALTPDNIIRSPELKLPGGRVFLYFRAAPWSGLFNGETMSVFVSRADGSDAVEIFPETPIFGSAKEFGFVSFLIDISAFGGQEVSVGFRHSGCTDLYALFLDDVRIYCDDRLPCDGSAGCPGRDFTDMPAKTNWAHDPIDWAVVYNITNGTSATKFSPDKGCTRAQAVTFLWRAMGCPEPMGGDNPFTDVKPGDYFFNAVLWAVERGITNGTSATKFSPDSTCTRGQIATFIWRTKGSPSPSDAELKFTDVKADDYYRDAVLWAAEEGITTGTSKTTFSPNGTCTRAHIVTFLYRCFFAKG